MANIEYSKRPVMSQSIYLITDCVMSVKTELLEKRSEDQPQAARRAAVKAEFLEIRVVTSPQAARRAALKAEFLDLRV